MNILTIVLVLLNSLSIAVAGWFGIKLVKLNNKYDMLLAKKQLLEMYVQKQPEPVAVENTEGFLKFISESRDWAFQYIEDAQVALTHFKSVVGPVVDYFDQYGDKMAMEPNFKAMEQISAAYKELVLLLPSEE